MNPKPLISVIAVFIFTSCSSPVQNLEIKSSTSIENTAADKIITAVVGCTCDSPAVEKTFVINTIQPRETRSIDSLCKNLRITKIKAAYFGSFPESTATKTIIQIVVTALLGIIGSICFFIYQKNHKSRHEIKILIGEMEDVRRHFIANHKWITELIKDFRKGGVPLRFYLERFNTWDDLIMNSTETYRTVPRSCIRPLAHARLHVRNTDTEIKTLLEYVKQEKISGSTLDEYWKFISQKHEFLIDWFELSIGYMKDAISWGKILNPKKANRRLNIFIEAEKQLREKQPMNVIRELYKFERMDNGTLDIRNRDSAEISLHNFIIMPPDSKVSETGLNILHMNSKTSPFKKNPSAKEFIEKIRSSDPGFQPYPNDSTTLRFAVEKAMQLNEKGLFLEFGFCSGTSLNFIGALAYDRKVYGFDSLKGLKNKWRTNFDAGTFAYKNETRFPFVPLPNVSLVIGWIEETLPLFANQYLENDTVSFINIDSDTFESAKFVLDNLKEKIAPGKTIIMLDEGYNFSDTFNGDTEWEKHEFSAVNEFAKENNLAIKYLAYNENHQQLVLMFENKG